LSIGAGSQRGDSAPRHRRVVGAGWVRVSENSRSEQYSRERRVRRHDAQRMSAWSRRWHQNLFVGRL